MYQIMPFFIHVVIAVELSVEIFLLTTLCFSKNHKQIIIMGELANIN